MAPTQMVDKDGVHIGHQHLSDRIKDLISTAQYLVVVRRYDTPTPQYGLHFLEPLDGQRFPFRLVSLGCYGEEFKEVFADYCVQVHCYNRFRLASVEDPKVIDFIGDQVIPIEWKTGYADRHRDTVRRIEVLR